LATIGRFQPLGQFARLRGAERAESAFKCVYDPAHGDFVVTRECGVQLADEHRPFFERGSYDREQEVAIPADASVFETGNAVSRSRTSEANSAESLLENSAIVRDNSGARTGFEM
jgi:hypothetical protein